jgi:hypothetical protein
MSKENEKNIIFNEKLIKGGGKPEDQKEIFHELRILCWHKELNHEDKWMTEKLIHEEQFKYVLNHCDINCKFEYMQTWQD